MAIPGEEKGCTDFNVFSGAENGILKCISINTKANLLKNFNHNSAPLDREQEITWYVFSVVQYVHFGTEIGIIKPKQKCFYLFTYLWFDKLLN
jgi:hypothetical protein